MIALDRVREKEKIVTGFRNDTRINRLVRLMEVVRDQTAAGEPIDLSIKSKWSDTKDQLLAETHGKCAYCESDMAAVAFGDVEHYRPKSVYWWLAYVYDNYLASCAICNQQFKSARFEFTGTPMPGPVIDGTESEAELRALARLFSPHPLRDDEVAAFVGAHHAEAPLIPNPYFDDPETFFAWEVFEGVREVLVVPRPGNARAEAVVEACERIYGLNRPQLKRRRFKQWEAYAFRRRVAEESPGELQDIAQELVDTMRAADSEYAGMVRFFEAAAQTG
jgi:hypothetical protein